MSDVSNGPGPYPSPAPRTPLAFLRLLLHTMPLTAVPKQSVLADKMVLLTILQMVQPSHFTELETEVQKT